MNVSLKENQGSLIAKECGKDCHLTRPMETDLEITHKLELWLGDRSELAVLSFEHNGELF